MIYFENSLKKRNLFFGEPLIQHLWSLYRAECSDQFCAYLQEVSLQAHGKEKVLRLTKDASRLQEATDFQIFP